MGKGVTPELASEALAIARAERAEMARKWYEENTAAVDAYNKMIETDGLFSDGMRTF